MNSENSSSPLVLSLKWKVLFALSLLLLGIYTSFFWLGIETLRQQQRSQFDLMTQRFANSLNHVLESNALTWSNITSLLTTDNADIDTLQTRITTLWPTLQKNWALQSFTLIDANLTTRNAFGKPLEQSALASVASAAQKSGKTVSNFSCASTHFDSNCSLITALPLHLKNSTSIAVISLPITDMILNLSRANLIEAAVLIREQQKTGTDIDKWNLNLVAASDLDATFELLQAASTKIALADLTKSGTQIGADGHRYYIRAIDTGKVNNSANLLIVLIDDITAQYNALIERYWQIAIAALIAMLISELFLLLILWQPMERIKWQAKVLPLLADGDYYSVYLGPSYRNVRYRDELDILEDSSISLAKNLEKMGIDIRKRSSELEYIAFYDVLTGLGNRRTLDNALNYAISSYENNQSEFALLFIDLDNFKRINDSLGHDIGDNLLIEVGRRLLSVIRSSDVIARFGGDEFVVILRNIDNREDVAEAARKLLHALRTPIAIDDRQLYVSGSIGIVLAPVDGIDAATLMKNADLAMYRAKMRGRNTFQFFTSAISESANRLLDLEIDLETALAENQFLLFYQPIVSLVDQQVVGLEALVRWKHPAQGMISPAEFVPVMEQNGMISKLDRKVMAMACQDLNFLQTQTGRDLNISINLSSNELRDPTLVGFLQSQIEKYGIKPHHLKVEITESVLMEDVDYTALILRDLKSLNVKVAIDDFGTGYSSLNYLKKLPVDELKIDRSFVCDTPGEASSAEIVAAVIAMSHKLNIKVVAEGIEHSQQIDFLKNCQCDFGQGYYFQRPLSRDSIITWLQQLDAPTPNQIMAVN